MTPEEIHTRALLNHKLASLSDSAAGLAEKLQSGDGQSHSDQADEFETKALDAFSKALSSYAGNAPMRALCEFDEIQTLKRSDEDHAAFKLYYLNERLREGFRSVPMDQSVCVQNVSAFSAL